MPSKFIKKRRQESFDIFSPKGIPGLVLWLDASDIFSMTFNGNAVSQWNDKSGNNNNAIQDTAANQPTFVTSGLNGKPSVLFTAANTQKIISPLNITTSGGTFPFTIVSVFYQNSGSGPVWEYNSSTDYVQFFPNFTDGNRYITTGSNEWSAMNPSDYPSGNNYISMAVYGTAILNHYGNGSLKGSVNRTNASFNQFILGQRSTLGEYFDGYIAEVIVYNTALVTSNQQAVENYLASKWGINI